MEAHKTKIKCGNSAPPPPTVYRDMTSRYESTLEKYFIEDLEGLEWRRQDSVRPVRYHKGVLQGGDAGVCGDTRGNVVERFQGEEARGRVCLKEIF